MKTICLTNNKGGVSKTVTAINLASVLASHGNKVLLVDTDPQANLTSFFNSSYIEERGTSYDLFNGKAANPVQVRENIFLIPSESGLVAYEVEHHNDKERELALKKGLATVHQNFDVCIIDTPPAVCSILVNSLVAADFCLIPSTVDGFSIQGVIQIFDVLKKVQETMNKQVRLLGVFLTMYDNRRVTKQGEALMKEALGEKLMHSTIRNTCVVREACAEGKTLFEMKYNAVQEDFKALAEEVTARMKNTLK